ncbi:MAG: fumarylacetoacetate hydrolase family protein [Rhodospirillaceae bacterium]|jgi:2-keto-4-pentenoate hydratase/2-oxohepta-3-ene-1,7-dioic acid hydratase in catechol pathway|nr:fumarylacetoacetate hydrolase family protein [Rhodospirillaceae bacterium]MBT7487128.1 fumarylacetoacetate hydrolase family protein [Rhodospirillales bacterium]MBT4700307.1 fumarylacetoacetate hydrolase family protein [Rhodospirillaceae bacterium]MBT5036156.1 fumarylacetoacetate hydrolase family protein [Rhodospirillaceae bacterium]MBT6218639.1 fumarylacetoacetate hydrolase family protein [Rhodospirillaceae bacterium]
MTTWIRFESGGATNFGTFDGDKITIHHGNMFDNPSATSETVALADVNVLTPCEPSKMLALWNNYGMLATKLELTPPPEPLYFIKANSSFAAQKETVHRPKNYDGPVIFEGELGVVIGKATKEISEEDAADHIFGYTCINDITAAGIIPKDETFAQWSRAKGYDGFGVFGPVISTDVDPLEKNLTVVLNGDVRQDYPLSDMIFKPHQLVSLLSHDMTLLPGDVICVGTNVGVGSMKLPSNDVAVTIDGIGTLENVFKN